MFVTSLLIKRFSKKGNSVLSYNFTGELLSVDINQTPKSFEYIRDKIIFDIQKTKDEYNFERIDLIASSLGVVSACMVANNNKNINNLFFIVPGDCLASSLWNGLRTQKIKKKYSQQGISEDKLKDKWSKVAPRNNLNGLNDKKIFIAISKADKIIRYKFGREFANILKNKYPKNITIEENRHLGHYFTVGKYYLFDDELLK